MSTSTETVSVTDEEILAEEWRPVVGYEERYEVSSLGRVRSLLGSFVRILKPTRDTRGYLKLNLLKGGVPANARAHRLVAMAFLPREHDERCEVNHKNGVKTDNRLCNLEWVTPSQNIAHSFAAGLHSKRKRYIYYCPELGVTALGQKEMARQCAQRGVSMDPSQVRGTAFSNGKWKAHGLSFQILPDDHPLAQQCLAQQPPVSTS